jgi:hypothetical protein
MISANEIEPKTCLDCHKRLSKPSYGRLFDAASKQFGIVAVGLQYANQWFNNDNHYILCPCGAIYVWSYDETGFNGGIWKQRHILPLFDSKQRLEIARFQIARHLKNHSKAYSPDLLEKYKKMVEGCKI